MQRLLRRAALPVLLAVAGMVSAPAPLAAAPASATPPAPAATYADLADLADSAPMVVLAQVRRQVRVEPERAYGVRPGWARFYFEAKTVSLLAGNSVIGESLRYLGDLPLDPRGKAPALVKKPVLLFAGMGPPSAAGIKSSELRLVSPDAQLLWDPASEAKLRAILSELLATGAPPRIAGVREAINVAGDLAGQSETQIFLATRDSSAAALSVARRPGIAPTWGVSWSEAAEGGAAPPRETLRWYRLACFLPPALPRLVNLSESPAEKAQAEADYRLVMGELGACPRLRR